MVQPVPSETVSIPFSSPTSDRSGVPGEGCLGTPHRGLPPGVDDTVAQWSGSPGVSLHKPKPRIVALQPPPRGRSHDLKGIAGGASKQATSMREVRLSDRACAVP